MSGRSPGEARARLAEGQGPLARLLAEAAAGMAEVPRGARERVAQRLREAAPAPRRALLLGAGLAALAGAAALLLLARASPPPAAPLAVILEVSGPVEASGGGLQPRAAAAGLALPAGARLAVGPGGSAVLGAGGARVALAERSAAALDREGGSPRLSLESGALAVRAGPVSVDASLLVVAAGAVRIEGAAASVIAISASAERVAVHALAGSARVRTQEGTAAIAPGASWASAGTVPGIGEPERALAQRTAPAAADLSPAPASPAAPPAPAAVPAPEPAGAPAPEPAAASPSRLLARAAADAQARGDEALHARAHQLEAGGRYADAAAAYQELADRGGPRAEPALYELGRLRLRFLGQPAAALEALEEHRRRYPDGTLALEAELTAIEARLALGQDAPALREIDAFLARHGDNERAAEVRRLRESLLQRRGSGP